MPDNVTTRFVLIVVDTFRVGANVVPVTTQEHNVPATRRQPSLAAAQSVPFEPKTAALLAAGAEPFHWDEVTHYASEGFNGATMLFADMERTEWVKTAAHTAAEGELVISWDSRPHSRVTWAQPVAAAKKAA